jgi:alkaline phosphatase D
MIALIALVSLAVPKVDAPVERIGLGSCMHQNNPQPIWEQVLRARPDTFVFLGDNIYASQESEKDKPAQYAKFLAVPNVLRLLESTRALAVWDDHDYGVNDGGEEYPEKRQAQKEFCDFWKVPADSPRRTRDGIYDAVTLGPEGRRVQFILLDTRYNRSPLNRERNVDGSYNAYLPTEKGTMLGEPQWKWLEEQLRQPAQLRIICSSIQVVPEDHMFEKWSNLPAERTRLFTLIRDTRAEGVLFVSGDRHLAEISLCDGGVGYPLYDLTASAINSSRKAWRYQEPNRHRVGTMNYGDNFGMIEIDWGKVDPVISLQIRGEEGESVIQQRFPLSLLKRRES